MGSFYTGPVKKKVFFCTKKKNYQNLQKKGYVGPQHACVGPGSRNLSRKGKLCEWQMESGTDRLSAEEVKGRDSSYLCICNMLRLYFYFCDFIFSVRVMNLRCITDTTLMDVRCPE